MGAHSGRSRRLSLARRLVGDFLAATAGIPHVTVSRWFDLGDLAGVRARMSPRVGWCALFTHAFAQVAARRPELRTAYLSTPWPRLYEHPEPIAGVVIERQLEGEAVPLVAVHRRPWRVTPADLESWLREMKAVPVRQIDTFHRSIQVARLPRPLRRLAWHAGLNWCGPARCRHFGTFGVSAAGAAGTLRNLVTPWPVALSYGPVSTAGAVETFLTFDHRVLDGVPAALALTALESEIRQQLTTSLSFAQVNRPKVRFTHI